MGEKLYPTPHIDAMPEDFAKTVLMPRISARISIKLFFILYHAPSINSTPQKDLLYNRIFLKWIL